MATSSQSPFTPKERRARPLTAMADIYLDYYRGWSEMLLGGFDSMTKSYTTLLQASQPEPGGIDIPKTRKEALNLAENEKEIVLTAEIPGFKDDEVEARIRDGRLTIKGERHESDEEDEFHVSFRREVPVPLSPRVLKGDGSRTSYRDGVLEVRIPKPDHAEPKSHPDRPQEKSDRLRSESKPEKARPKPRRPRRPAAVAKTASKSNGRSNSKQRTQSKRKTGTRAGRSG